MQGQGTQLDREGVTDGGAYLPEAKSTFPIMHYVAKV